MTLEHFSLPDISVALINKWVVGQFESKATSGELQLQLVHALRYFTACTTKVQRYELYRQEIERRSHRPYPRKRFNDRINSVPIELARRLEGASQQAVDAVVVAAVQQCVQQRVAKIASKRPASTDGDRAASHLDDFLKSSAIYPYPVQYRYSITPGRLPFLWEPRWRKSVPGVITDRKTGQTFTFQPDVSLHGTQRI